MSARLILFLGLLLASPAAMAQAPGDPMRGKEFAAGHCATCHAIDPNDDEQQLDGAPSFYTIANTPGMTATAIAVFLQTPHATMPNFIITEQDMDNVVAYISTLKRQN